MWSKRLADIRPGTVISYLFLLLGLGYLKVLFGTVDGLRFFFLGHSYIVHDAVKWAFPFLAGLSAMFANFWIAEVFQILKRYSYFGFLWGLSQLTLARFDLLVISTLALLFFGVIVRLQRSSRYFADYLDIGLVIGGLSLLDMKYIWLLPLSWLLLLAYGRLRWRAIFIGIWGLVTIHILTATVAWISGEWEYYRNCFQVPDFRFIWPQREMIPWIVVTLVWWIVSLKEYVIALSRANIVKRQSLSALLILQLGTLILTASGIWPYSFALAFFMVGSLMFIVNDLQYRHKNWWKDVVFWTYIAIYGLSFIS